MNKLIMVCRQVSAVWVLFAAMLLFWQVDAVATGGAVGKAPPGDGVVATDTAKVSDRAGKLAAEAPKTPEAFLRLVREWMDDPYMDGYGFAERITGVEREKWGPFDTAWDRRDYTPAYHMRNNGLMFPVPYEIISLQITSSNHLRDIIIPSPDKTFCVSAGMVNSILGEPDRILGLLPNSLGIGVSKPTLKYLYNSEKYKLYIHFTVTKSFKDLHQFTLKQRKHMERVLSKNDCYTDLCATYMRFGAE